MASNGRLEYQITVPTGGWTATVGGTLATVAAGTYYLSSPGSGAADLLATIGTAFATAAATSCTVTASLAGNGTGLSTIAFGVSKAITWISADLRDVLGFTANQGAATSHVSPRHVRGAWLPTCPFYVRNSGDLWRGHREGDYRARESAAGHVFSLHGQHKTVLEPLRWGGVKQKRIWIVNEVVVHESLERFWLDGMWGEASWGTPGGPLRWHPCSTGDDTYGTYRPTAGTEIFNPDHLREGFAGLWSVTMPRMIQVPDTEALGVAVSPCADDPAPEVVASAITALKFTNGYWPTPVPITSGGDLLYYWKQGYVGGDATVLRSGTGTAGTYSAVGDLLTSGAVADTALAWCVVRLPDGIQQYCVQHVSGLLFRIKYSPAAGFVGGSPDEDTTPTATDEQLVLGTGTDAAPTGAAWHATIGSSPYFFMGVDRAAPWGAWSASKASTGTSGMEYHAFLHCPIVGAHAADTNPIAFYNEGSSPNNPWLTTRLSFSGNSRCFDVAGTWRATNVLVQAPDMIEDAIAVDPGDGLHFGCQPIVGAATSAFVKGWTKIMATLSMDDDLIAANRRSTFDHPDGTVNGLIRVGQYVVPWRGTPVTEYAGWTNRGMYRLLTALLG